LAFPLPFGRQAWLSAWLPCILLSFAHGQEDTGYASVSPYAVVTGLPMADSAAAVDSATAEDSVGILPDTVARPAPESVIALPEVRVAARGPVPIRPPVSDTRGLEAADLERAVSAFGDPARIARLLPGAGRGNDWETELSVRGGSPDQSGFLVDGMQLARVSHYEGLRGEHGGIGILNLAFVDSIRIHAGTFPARFPDRLSGLVEVRYRDGDSATRQENLTTDVSGAGGSAEGPLPGRAGSYAAAARYSAMDLLIRSGLVKAYGVPDYFNGQARITVPLGGAALRARFIGGREDWSNRIGDESTLDLEGRSLAASLSLDSKGEGRNASARLLYEERDHRAAFASWGHREGSGGDNMTRLESGRERKWGAAIERFSSPRAGWTFGAGATAQSTLGSYRNRSSDQATYLAYQDTVIELSQDLGSDGNAQANAAAFAEATWTGRKAEVYVGYRHFYERSSDRHALGPRLAFRFLPASGHALRAAFGLHSQPHDPADLSERPDPSRARLPYMAQAETGWEWSPARGLAASLDLFAKEGYRLARQAYSPLANGYTQIYRDTGRTRARGFEASIRTPRTRSWDFSAAYAYLRYRERHADGSWGPGAYSLPHNLNLAAGRAVAPGLWLTGRVSAGSGSPYTPFDSVTSKLAGTGVYQSGQAFARRGAPYYRLDARIDWERSMRGARVGLFLEVENLLDRHNESGRQWNVLDGRETPIEGMGRLPVAGASLRF
jgi:hypothetical protein